MNRTTTTVILCMACIAFGVAVGRWVIPAPDGMEAYTAQETARLNRIATINEELNRDPEYLRLAAQVAAEKAQAVKP